MHNYSRLNNLIKSSALKAVENTKPTKIVFGIVKSEDPLIIEIEQKIPLNKNQLILSRNVTDYKTKISFDNPDITHNVNGYLPGTTHKIDKLEFTSDIKNDITIYNGLKKDEEVILIRLEGGQEFIVWDRKVSI